MKLGADQQEEIQTQQGRNPGPCDIEYDPCLFEPAQHETDDEGAYIVVYIVGCSVFCSVSVSFNNLIMMS